MVSLAAARFCPGETSDRRRRRRARYHPRHGQSARRELAGRPRVGGDPRVRPCAEHLRCGRRRRPALAARVPGLFVESSNGPVAPRFYIRGLGNTDFDLAASQPVSVVMDEVVMENVTLKSFPIFDVDRIEVLRGPQGTCSAATPRGHRQDQHGPADPGVRRTRLGQLWQPDTLALDAAVGGPLVADRLAGAHLGDARSGAATSSTTASPARTTPMADIPISPRAPSCCSRRPTA